MTKVKILLLACALILITSACSISFNAGGSDSNESAGGIFKSTNQGDLWSRKNAVPTISGKPVSIGALDNVSFIIDPGDRQALYYGSLANGLFFTYDGADTWQLAKSLGKVTVRAVAVDPQNRCLIYVAVDNKALKSNDCSRSWKQIYYDNDLTVTINAINIDFKKSEVVYIGTSRGEIIRSFDYGENWQTLNRFAGAVSRIAISPHDNRVIFVATLRDGLHRTNNGGNVWTNLNEHYRDFDGANIFKEIVLPAAEQNLVFLASNYGLLKSTDNGDSWEKISLLTPEEHATINSLAVNPKNAKEIYYVTNTTFYRSLDGGESWNTKKLPSGRAGWKLLIDHETPTTLYLSVKKLQK